MKKILPLNYKYLRQKLAISQLDFTSTTEITALTDFIGQERALEALTFGIDIKSQGYNLYAMGPSGIGKRSLVKTVVSQYASQRPIPSDWCYIHNFDTPEKPIALRLPPGAGIVLQQNMKSFVAEVGSGILALFESDDYHTEIEKIHEEFNAKRKEANSVVPSEKGQDSKKVDNTPKFYKEQQKKEKAYQLKLVTSVVEPSVAKIKAKYTAAIPAAKQNSVPGHNEDVLAYLAQVQQDMLQHYNDFIKEDEKTDLLTFSLENPALTKYKVNVIVDNSQLKGAPVIFEDAPTYSTLISRVEHTTHLGAPVTNFSLIKAGCLHQANGGYLIIEARKLIKHRVAWEALKSALYSRQIKIKPPEQSDEVQPISLEPMPIPLDIKIILLGNRNTYYTLCQEDPDFTELFKVAIDFDEAIDRNKKNIKLYARLIGTIAKKNKLHPFHASAVAAIIDHSSRLIEDNEKLSTHVRDIEDVILEADYWTSSAHKKEVEATEVKRAIAAQIHRMDRTRELYYEDIHRAFIIIKTTGSAVGQVNCLSVRKVGNFEYGHPTRVTARVRLGKGKLIDIQREIKMAGPMHSKAGLIISNFLASRFNRGHVFSLAASLSFEQVYCWTDGDSASVGELCALLSALAEIPIYQFFAITGSIDQYGEVQAIGGVNEKIEGFFDVCKAKGLNGQQGVIIPAVNKKNLMLREDIVAAAKAKKFAIYPIETIDQAVAMLTGMPAGARNKKGKFATDSVYYQIEQRLALFTKNRK
jgi:lon-related putative ATP-dependent protease